MCAVSRRYGKSKEFPQGAARFGRESCRVRATLLPVERISLRKRAVHVRKRLRCEQTLEVDARVVRKGDSLATTTRR